MLVYVVLVGDYEDATVSGVFLTLARAQQAHPLKRIPAFQGPAGSAPEHVGSWIEAPREQGALRCWHNTLDGPDHVAITECEIRAD